MAKTPPHGIGAAPPKPPPHGIQVPTGPTGPTGPAVGPFRVTVPGPSPGVPASPFPTPATPNTGPPPPDDGSGSGSGGSGDGSAGSGLGYDPNAFAADWYQAFFSQYGLPADLQAQLVNILKTYAASPSTAMALATQLLRTSAWYQQTFPGFSQGVANGLFTDETGYRNYLNNVNQAFNQYLGRQVTSSELSGYISSGYAPSYVGNLLQGKAWASANGQDVRQVTGQFGDTGQISDQQLGTLGNEKAGIDTATGQSLDAMIQRAQQRLSTVFNGRLATPSGLGIGGGASLSAAGLTRAPDVAA